MPTKRRQVSNGSISSIDKPLPPIRLSEDGPSVPPQTRRVSSHPIRGSNHIRQGATIHEDDSSSPTSSLYPSPQPPSLSSFSDDVAGMFDGIGQSDPARELGLPPESLRDKDRRRLVNREHFAADLGKPPSAEPPRGLMPASLPSAIPARRSSSQAAPYPKLDVPPGIPQRRSSSPNPSMREELSLHPLRKNSSTSSTSSRRRARNIDNTQKYATESAAPLGSPLLISNAEHGDFAQPVGSGDATIRAKARGDDLIPLSPQSVRLISSPGPDSALFTNLTVSTMSKDPGAPTSFIATSPWGAQSPHPVTPGRTENLLDFGTSPVVFSNDNSENDKEKGRRLACEFLENNYSHVGPDKVAMFLGGP